MVLGRLHVIVNVSPGTDRAAALELARAVVGAGAPVVQLRAKGLTDAALLALAVDLQDVCARAGAQCVVNDRADVARAVGAAGVHVGEEDLPVGAVRTVLGPDAIVGATARDAAAARAAVAAGATYVGVGPCYATSTKVVGVDPIGVVGLRAVTGAIGVPVIAIAGITADRVPELLAAGAYGVAVVGAVAGAADPSAATRALLDALQGAP